jgi:tetratricopeptide (TPR) repeat protein
MSEAREAAESADRMVQGDEAGQLLSLLAFLGEGPVPTWLFGEGRDLLPTPLRDAAAAGTGALAGPIRELVTRELAEEAEGGVSVPSAVAAAVRDSMTGVETSRFAGLAVALLDRGFPERIGRAEDEGRTRLLAPAVEAAAAHVSGGGEATARAAHLLGRLGSFYGLSGHPEDARRAFESAIALAEGEAGGGPLEGPLRAVLADEHAAVLAELDRLEEARREATRALELARQALPEDAPQLPVFLLNVGRTLRRAGDPNGSRTALSTALARAEAAASPAARPLALEIRMALAELALAEGRAGEAATVARELLEGIDELEEPELAARAAWILGDSLREGGDGEAATDPYRRSLALDERRYGPGHPGVGQKCLGLGLHLEELGRAAEAREAYARALAIFEAALGADSDAAGVARGCLERLAP